MNTAAAAVNDEIMYHKHGFADHVGRSFLMGSAVGIALSAVARYQSAPTAGRRRLAGAARTALKRAPGIGGFIAAYSGLLYVFEGGMAGARGRHDRWNTAAASAAAFGLIHVPLVAGPSAVASAALVGAAFGGMFDAALTTIHTGTEAPLGSISIDHKQKGS